MYKNRIDEWKKYSKKSDMMYRKVFQENGNLDLLKNHNIILKGKKELDMIFKLAHCILGWEFSSCKTALDVCCGAGYMTNCLNSAGFSAHGIDLCEDAISLSEKNFPECTFSVCDATNPDDVVLSSKYDFVLIREAHPFSRINEWEYQKKILDKYLNSVSQGGMMVIAHATFGGGMNYDSLDFQLLKEYLRSREYTFTGPFNPFFIKQLRFLPFKKKLIPVYSKMANVVQRLTNQRWIEVFLILK